MIKYLSIPKLALAVDVNENTIRRYIKRFPAYFVDTQIESRIIKYNPDVIDILKDIKIMYQDKGYDRDTIRENLKLKYSKDNIDKPSDAPDTQNDRLKNIEKRIEDIAAKLNKLLKYFQNNEQVVDAPVDSQLSLLDAPVDNQEQKADTPEQDVSIIIDDILTGTPEQMDTTLTEILEQKESYNIVTELVTLEGHQEQSVDLQDYKGKELTTPERDILLLKVKEMFIDQGKKASRLSADALNDAGILTATGKTWTAKNFIDNYRTAKKRADKETSKD